MIKTSGYRVSPTEVEEVLYATQLVGECAAFGVDHPQLGQAIHVIVTPPPGQEAVDQAALMAACRARMPAYMVPATLDERRGPCPAIPTARSTAAVWPRPCTSPKHERDPSPTHAHDAVRVLG